MTEEIYPHGSLDYLGIQFGRRPADILPGVGYQDVHLTPARQHLPNQVIDLKWLGDVRGYDQGFSVRLANLGGDFLQQLNAARGQGDLRPALGESQRGCPADPA